jgi:hypothetical protein
MKIFPAAAVWMCDFRAASTPFRVLFRKSDFLVNYKALHNFGCLRNCMRLVKITKNCKVPDKNEENDLSINISTKILQAFYITIMKKETAGISET